MLIYYILYLLLLLSLEPPHLPFSSESSVPLFFPPFRTIPCSLCCFSTYLRLASILHTVFHSMLLKTTIQTPLDFFQLISSLILPQSTNLYFHYLSITTVKIGHSFIVLPFFSFGTTILPNILNSTELTYIYLLLRCDLVT